MNFSQESEQFPKDIPETVPDSFAQQLKEQHFGNRTVHEEEFLEYEEDSRANDKDTTDVYDIVDSIVPRYDNPMEPALTFRVIVLGTLTVVILGICNSIFSLRTNLFTVNKYFILVVTYPIGNFMYWSLSTRTYTVPYFKWTFTLNPGPFSFKEQALIYICAQVGANPPYAAYNIIAQKFLLGQDISLFWCIAFGIVTQIVGYGISGLCRKFLVRPAGMIWPRQLAAIATLKSLHKSVLVSTAEEDDHAAQRKADATEDNRKMRFFWICALGMCIYQVIPGIVAPLLSAVSLMCYFGPFNQRVRMLGSPIQGVGLASLSFDWSIIGQFGPIITPLSGVVNQAFGSWLFVWFIVPILWINNSFGSDQILGTSPVQGPNGTNQFPLGQALNTASLFNKDGLAISPMSLVASVNNTLVLNSTAYAANKPMFITTYNAVHILAMFITFSAALSHAVLWNGKDILHRISRAMKDLDTDDIHAQLIDQYKEVPDSWYGVLLAGSTIAMFAICTWGGFALPWWGVVLAIGMVCATIVPFGIIEGVTGQRVATNVESELIFGFILPGRIIENMTFKTISYVGTQQALGFLEDLKLGHFVKIPPRTIFGVQIAATVISGVVDILVMTNIYARIGSSLNITSPAGAIWGGIGSAEFFGSGSAYSFCFWGFAIGLVAPIIPYILHSWFPKVGWHLVNVPLISWMFEQVGSVRSDLITPLLVGWFVNGFIKKRWFLWWQRFAFVMSSAFDFGSGVGIVLCLLVYLIAPSFRMPVWAMNPTDGDGCTAPALVGARLLSALQYPVIADCDEVFNYWEPTHFLLYGAGFRTWEYAPEYNIRSWLYAGIHALLGWAAIPFVGVDEKISVFFAIRAMFAVFSAFAEYRLLSETRKWYGRTVSNWLLLFLLFAPGMTAASTAYLPSSFSMYFITLAFANSLNPTPSLVRTTSVVGLACCSVVVGWPFSGAAVIPFAVQDLLLQSGAPNGCSRFARFRVSLMVGIFVGGGLLAIAAVIDRIFYGFWSVVPVNIVLYNVFSGEGQGPDIFGTEPWNFYLINGFLNFNIAFIAALLSFPILIISRSSLPQPTALVSLNLMPVYLWLAIFSAQPHKEERFLFVIYPLVAFTAAVATDRTLTISTSVLHHFHNKAAGSQKHGKKRKQKSKPRSPVVLILLVSSVFVALSTSRLAAMVTNYGGPLYIWRYLGRHIMTPKQEVVCVGAEWHRFTSHFFVPANVSVEFVESGFHGLLPAKFKKSDEGAKPLWMRTREASSAGTNAQNRWDPERVVDASLCDYLVDSSNRNEYGSNLQRYWQQKGWEVVECSQTLDAGSTRGIIGRAFWAPDSVLPFVGGDFRQWADVCLLKRR
ncbi:mannosyltransferase [Entophlyctis luteolus]|nr:mannosyltransferase [Entophlyctis luteolus]